MCSQESNWHLVSIGSSKGLAPRRRQAITWNNDNPVHRRIYVALRGDDLNRNRQAYMFHWGCFLDNWPHAFTKFHANSHYTWGNRITLFRLIHSTCKVSIWFLHCWLWCALTWILFLLSSVNKYYGDPNNMYIHVLDETAYIQCLHFVMGLVVRRQI